MSLSDLRRDYSRDGLLEGHVDPDPFKQFQRWMEQAIHGGLHEPNAVTLATAAPDGRPSARIVLLKGFDERGFVFFTNYLSEKGRQLEANPSAALVFYWLQLERQVRISGPVEQTSREDSAAYFHSRPVGSQLSAWASKQSQVVDARQILDSRLEQMKERYYTGEIPLPPHWGGYRMNPDTLEFWQGRPNR